MWCKSLIASIACLSLIHFTFASEGSPAPPEEAERITALVEQLQHDLFSERQAASQSLAEAGAIALPQLEAAATGRSREAAGRALDIVKRHFQNGDAALKNDAQQVLSRLSNSENAALAQRARNVLDPPRTSMLPEGFPFPNARNMPFPNGRNIQFVPPPMTRTHMAHESNGRREVEVRENGRKTKIQTLPNGQIQFEFTEEINGRDVTRRIEAKDLNELKTKNAEAGQLYDLYDAAPRPTAQRRSNNSRG